MPSPLRELNPDREIAAPPVNPKRGSDIYNTKNRPDKFLTKSEKKCHQSASCDGKESLANHKIAHKPGSLLYEELPKADTQPHSKSLLSELFKVGAELASEELQQKVEDGVDSRNRPVITPPISESDDESIWYTIGDTIIEGLGDFHSSSRLDLRRNETFDPQHERRTPNSSFESLERHTVSDVLSRSSGAPFLI